MLVLDWVRNNVDKVKILFTQRGIAAFPRDREFFFSFQLYWDEKLKARGPQAMAIVDFFSDKANGHGDGDLLDLADLVYREVQELAARSPMNYQNVVLGHGAKRDDKGDIL